MPTADGMAIIGSWYGNAKHPAWRHNLRAHPDGEIDVEGERWAFRAVEVEDERRERIWQEALRPTRASPPTPSAPPRGASRCSCSIGPRTSARCRRRARGVRLRRDRLPGLPRALRRRAGDGLRARGRAGAAAARPRGARARRRPATPRSACPTARALLALHHLGDEREADRGDGAAAAHARAAGGDARVARAVPDRRHPRGPALPRLVAARASRHALVPRRAGGRARAGDRRGLPDREARRRLVHRRRRAADRAARRARRDRDRERAAATSARASCRSSRSATGSRASCTTTSRSGCSGSRWRSSRPTTLLERDAGAAAEELERVRELARGAMEELRAVVFELRPASLEAEGLRDRAAQARRRAAARVGARRSSCRVADPPRLPGASAAQVFRIAQEALQNALRHAEAEHIEVRLEGNGNGRARAVGGRRRARLRPGAARGARAPARADLDGGARRGAGRDARDRLGGRARARACGWRWRRDPRADRRRPRGRAPGPADVPRPAGRHRRGGGGRGRGGGGRRSRPSTRPT